MSSTLRSISSTTTLVFAAHGRRARMEAHTGHLAEQIACPQLGDRLVVRQIHRASIGMNVRPLSSARVCVRRGDSVLRIRLNHPPAASCCCTCAIGEVMNTSTVPSRM